EQPTVYLLGDSTMQTYDPYWAPQAGWGQFYDQFLSDRVIVDNRSIGGPPPARSSRRGGWTRSCARCDPETSCSSSSATTTPPWTFPSATRLPRTTGSICART